MIFSEELCFQTYLLFDVTVAADGPQIFESSPQQDYEQTPKESDHGGGEESPPHPLAVAVTGHVGRERDDHVHLGDVDRRVRVEFLPVFRHYRLLVTCQPSSRQSPQLGFRRFGEFRPAPPEAPPAHTCPPPAPNRA